MGDDQLRQLLLRAEVERLRGILEEREDAVLSLTNAAGEILWASSPGSSSLFRREAQEEFRGHHAAVFVHPGDLRSFDRALEMARAGRTASWEGRALDGEQRWRRVRSIMWRTQNSTELVSVTVAVRPPN
jgi:PAS domain-containing protein